MHAFRRKIDHLKPFARSSAGPLNRYFSTCKNKFHNIVNFRGEPYVPGFELAQQHNFQYYK
ncbi:MAG: phage BR0599 family protein [Rickettsiales bacterium]|nr:phage BR0599 family protein [Rickettsiales bacterium]